MKIPTAVTAALFLTMALHPAPASAVTAAEVAAAAAAQHIVPRYQSLRRSTRALAEAAGEQCHAAPEALKAAYHAVMDDWMRIQHIRFGPIQTGTRAARLQYWPDRKGRGQRQLAALLRDADPRRLEPAAFAATSVAVQGLPALELLLFQPRRKGGDDAYRCQVVAAIGRNLAELAATLADEWTTGPRPFRQSLERPSPEDVRFHSPDEVIAALLTDMHTSLRVIIDQKLGRVLDAGQVQPKRAESWRSRRSLRNIRLNLESLQALFDGEPGPAFNALLLDAPDGAGVADQVGYVIKALLLQIDALDKPLYETASDAQGAVALARLRGSLETMDAILLENVAVTLDVPLGFNALDGD